ncbi:MAG: PQQ-dependent sugar dehydrogenase [Solirubrobacterales bacterium]
MPGRGNTGRRWFAFAVMCIAVALIGSGLASGSDSARQAKVGNGQGGILKRQIGTFASPTYVASALGAPSYLYVVEQRGTVAVIDHGHERAQPFLDIRGQVSAGGEQGLLSIAFDPAYDRNHLVYAYYTNSAGNIEIDEFRASSNTAVSTGSRRQVIVIQHPGASNHNGGQIEFGPDGDLYAATGDGGGAGDPHENAQNKQKLLGKLLRIKPHKQGSSPYTIPPGNPFVGKPGRDEIYALGLRNPYRFSFDRSRITIGDVGQDRFEEVDIEGRDALRGANFGWDHFEGFHVFNYPGDNESPRPKHNYRPPVLEYPHNPGRCAIIGGYVVRNAALTSLNGRYLYTDNCDGVLRSFVPQDGKAVNNRQLGIRVSSPSSFGEGPNGSIYVTSLNGAVFKLVHK